MRIASVDYDVARFEKGQQLLDHLIDGVAGLDHHHDAAWAFQRADQLFDSVGANNRRPRGFMLNKIVDLGDSAVEDGNFVSMVVHIKDQVLPHDGEADESDVTTLRLHKLSYFTHGGAR